MKVRITSSGESNCWYHNLVGQIFEVSDKWINDYIYKKMGDSWYAVKNMEKYLIAKSDCEIVPESMPYGNLDMKDIDSTLTKEQIAAPSYLDWDDETLGRMTRAMAKYLYENKIKGWESICTMAASYVLVNSCLGANADFMQFELNDFRVESEGTGNWEITVKKKEEDGSSK